MNPANETGVVALLLSATCWLSSALLGSVEPPRCDMNPVHVFASAPFASFFANNGEGEKDIISVGASKAADFFAGLSGKLYLLPWRWTVIFVAVLLVCGVSFLRCGPHRHAEPTFLYQQAGLAFFGLLLGLTIPVHTVVPTNNVARAWLFLLACALTLLLPLVVPFVVVMQAGWQSRLTKILYWLIGLSFLLTLVL